MQLFKSVLLVAMPLLLTFSADVMSYPKTTAVSFEDVSIPQFRKTTSGESILSVVDSCQIDGPGIPQLVPVPCRVAVPQALAQWGRDFPGTVIHVTLNGNHLNAI